jgi:hypothetical protein
LAVERAVDEAVVDFVVISGAAALLDALLAALADALCALKLLVTLDGAACDVAAGVALTLGWACAVAWRVAVLLELTVCPSAAEVLDLKLLLPL